MLLQLLCITFILLVLVSVYLRFSRAGRLMAKIPGPTRIPLIGNMLTMCKNPENMFVSLRHWHKTYGRIYQLSGAHIKSIHLSDPQDIEIIFSTTRHHRKAMPYTFLYSWLGRGLLVSNDDKWHQRRKMLIPAFHFNILNKFFKTFYEHTQDLLDSIENEVDKEKSDLIPLITKVALRIMCETSMGTKIREDTPSVNNYLKAVHKIGECIVQRLCTPWYYIDIVYMFSALSRTEKSVLPDLHKFTKQMIQKRREYNKVNHTDDLKDDERYKAGARPAMLDLLLEEEAKQRIDDVGIQEEVDTFLFEGHDTISTALNFMIMRIANEPEIQNSIYEELEGIFGNSQRQPVVEDLSKMKYLECCIKESLRLYPSVPFLSRHLTEDVVVANCTIPKNTFCDIHVFDIHRNPNVYPEPEKFIPERFLPENVVKRHPYSYIPFSAGPRNCIGQKFALMEMKTVMSGLLRRYRLEPVTKSEDLIFYCDLVLRTNHPIYVRFCKRNNTRTKELFLK